MSSARQRRRKSKQKQDLHGRKSRSSSDAFLETVKVETDGSQHADQMDHSPQVDCPPILDEVEDFFSLLNSTLCLPEAEAPVPPTSQAVAHPPPPPVLAEGCVLPSGRLAERIRALRLYVSSPFVAI